MKTCICGLNGLVLTSKQEAEVQTDETFQRVLIAQTERTCGNMFFFIQQYSVSKNIVDVWLGDIRSKQWQMPLMKNIIILLSVGKIPRSYGGHAGN